MACVRAAARPCSARWVASSTAGPPDPPPAAPLPRDRPGEVLCVAADHALVAPSASPGGGGGGGTLRVPARVADPGRLHVGQRVVVTERWELARAAWRVVAVTDAGGERVPPAPPRPPTAAAAGKDDGPGPEHWVIFVRLDGP